jgi:hypothetical protein
VEAKPRSSVRVYSYSGSRFLDLFAPMHLSTDMSVRKAHNQSITYPDANVIVYVVTISNLAPFIFSLSSGRSNLGEGTHDCQDRNINRGSQFCNMCDQFSPEIQPPDTGQMTATSSPPFSITAFASSTISAFTLHALLSSTLSRPVPG